MAESLPKKLQVRVGNGSFWVKFKFERLPNVCYRCGMLVHTELYCQKPLARDEEGNFQVWEQKLQAFPPRRQPRLPPSQPRALEFQRN